MLQILLPLLIAILWSIAPLLHKVVYKSGINPKTMMILSGLFYSGALAVYSALNYKSVIADWSKLNYGVVGLIAFAVIVTAFLSNLIYYYAIKKYPAFLVTGLSYAAPLFTVLIAWLFMIEHVSLLGLVGVVLIVSGTVCLARVDVKN